MTPQLQQLVAVTFWIDTGLSGLSIFQAIQGQNETKSLCKVQGTCSISPKRLKLSQTIFPRCFPLGIPPHSLSATHHEGPGDHVELLVKLQEVSHQEKEC